MEIHIIFNQDEQRLFGLDERPYAQGEVDGLLSKIGDASRGLSARSCELAQVNGPTRAEIAEIKEAASNQTSALQIISQLGSLATNPQQ